MIRTSVLLTGLSLTSCLKPLEPSRDPSRVGAVEKTLEQLRDPFSAEFKQTGSSPFKHVNVQILGDDILLPESDFNATFDQDRAYSFTVVAMDPKGRPMRELLASGDLRIEVIGAKASLSFPAATEGDKFVPANAAKWTEPAISKGVAQLTINLAENQRTLRPFTILAWFPNQFTSGQNQESWFARKDVRVYFGDVRTRVQIVGFDEARAMFGTTFAKNYFVGRVFLRNRSTSKSLAIYTTSMRVPVIFYRQSELEGTLTAAASEALTHMARQCHPPKHKTGCKICTPQNFKTADKRAAAGKETAKNPEPAENTKNLETDELQRAKDIVTEFRKKFPSPFLTPPSAKSAAPRTHGRSEDDALLTRVLAVWARMNGDDNYEKTLDRQLPPEQASQVVQWAFGNYSSDRPDTRTQKAADWSKTLTKDQGTQDNRDRRAAHARTIIFEAWRLLDAELERSNDTIKETSLELDILHSGIDRLVQTKSKDTAPPQADIYKRIAQVITAPDVEQSAIRENTPKEISKVVVEEDRATFADALEKATRLEHRLRQAKDVKTAILRPSGSPAPSLAAAERLALLQSRALGVGSMTSPLDDRHQVMMGPTPRNLAFSDDTGLQRKMVEGGYLWRDAYRPMTFQAVLNSVMFSHDRDPRTMTIKTLETIAMVAGGAVGLSGTVEELGRTGYLQSTNFFSSVLVPSLRGALVEDLRKHITNLGEMAMDTVVMLPPNESMDRYVFFPRGAIYNFPDEFDPTTPGYIAGIEGEDLYVEAAQVNTDQILRGGTDSGALVARALNEGERSEQSRSLQIAQTQARLRTAELANLAARIDSVMNSVPKESGPARDKALAAARSEINRMQASFTTYFGPDQSGTLGATLVKYGLTTSDTPPTVITGAPVELLAGADSLPIPIGAFDSETKLSDLAFELKNARPDWLAADPVFDSKSDPQSAYLRLSPRLGADRETVARTFDFAVLDTSGNRATASQGVLVHAPAFAKTHTVKIDGVTRQFAASATDVAFGKKRGVFEFTVPTFKSDGARLKLVASAGKSIEGVDVVPGRSTFDPANARLSLTVTVDGSASAGGTLPLNVYLVPADVPADPAADVADVALAKLTCNVNLDSK